MQQTRPMLYGFYKAVLLRVAGICNCAVHAVADQVTDAKSKLADNAVKFPNS